MLLAFLTQFPPDTFDVVYRPFLRTAAQVDGALAACEPAGAIVMHAVVTESSKGAIVIQLIKRSFCTLIHCRERSKFLN